ncbi:class I SAM-dependent methyltransferase [candidate division KSB1 bacterium]|nr:class I SAM-dependent methyltransferase [candidate division KSB1 bacterium]MCH8285041.1 class I SAM-dependent methyltransferase [candidate division KSB1 bacterium]
MVKEPTQKDWNEFWKRDGSAGDFYHSSDTIIENLLSVTDVRGLRILEIGAGTGGDSINLSKMGARVVALDYSEDVLKKVKTVIRNSGVSLDLMRGDGTNLPFPDECFDLIFHQGLLEHFKKPQTLVDENIRVLKKGGYLLIDVPQKYHLWTVVKHILIPLNMWIAGWETQFSVGALRKIYRDNRLTIVREYGYWLVPSFFYRLLRETLKWIGIKLPLYPGSIPLLGKLRKSLRSFLIKRPLSLHTFVSIGIIGKKE